MEVENLFIKFDLPGEFTNISRTYKREVENCIIYPSPLASTYEGVIAQTLHIECNSLFPGGHYSTTINYKPTTSKTSEFEEYSEENTPLMDLHDYGRYIAHWNYKDKLKSKREYLNLRNLTYIQLDNENLLKLSESYKNLEEVYEMEETRKDY